ncbi:hypothetical protein [Flavobacterium sp. GT3R68]|uniref:hypothetical protein n=1 Tax=Flavobacterium sp. GT3R68 TaxID=2594437 RepID=UPI0018F42CEC|nr:hypothetical protein [Flavobacterium sp. GT3R68]
METKESARSEGKVAKAIESQTAKLPSDLFLWAAAASIGISATFKLFGQKNTALFIGQWAPTFLLLGVYNKIVKVEGHDQQDRGTTQSTSREENAGKMGTKSVPESDYKPHYHN